MVFFDGAKLSRSLFSARIVGSFSVHQDEGFRMGKESQNDEKK